MKLMSWMRRWIREVIVLAVCGAIGVGALIAGAGVGAMIVGVEVEATAGVGAEAKVIINSNINSNR